jgi:hypothetical protein
VDSELENSDLSGGFNWLIPVMTMTVAILITVIACMKK